MPSLESLAFITNLPRNVIMCKFFFVPQKCCKEVLLECNAGKIVIVLAVDAFFTEEAVLLGIH
jgi:hypothetical protein